MSAFLMLRWQTFEEVGVDYCLTHNGIRNEDESDCDFSRGGLLAGEQVDCVFRPLGYIETRGRP